MVLERSYCLASIWLLMDDVGRRGVAGALLPGCSQTLFASCLKNSGTHGLQSGKETLFRNDPIIHGASDSVIIVLKEFFLGFKGSRVGWQEGQVWGCLSGLTDGLGFCEPLLGWDILFHEASGLNHVCANYV